MAILGFRTSTYAMNIFRFGTNRLTTRDGFTGIADGYYVPVEQYAAKNYDRSEIDNAFAMTWINEQEYKETIAIINTVTKLQVYE